MLKEDILQQIILNDYEDYSVKFRCEFENCGNQATIKYAYERDADKYIGLCDLHEQIIKYNLDGITKIMKS